MTAWQVWSGVGAALGWIGWALSPLLLLPLLGLILPRLLAEPMGMLSRAADNINMVIGWASKWLAVALVAVVCWNVVERYVFGIGTVKLQESILYLHAALFMLAVGATLLSDGHVRVDLIYARLGPRGQALTNLVGTYVFLIPVCILILRESAPYVASSWRVGEGSREIQGLPYVYLLKTLIPTFAILLLIQAFSLAANSALILTGRRSPEQTPETPPLTP